MKTARRALLSVLGAALMLAFFPTAANAVVTACTSSPTATAGGTISVSGSTNMDQSVRFVLDRGTPQAVTLGSLPSIGAPGVSQFNGTLTIPSNVATNTNHVLTATNPDDTFPFGCGTIFVLAPAPTASPTPVPTASAG
ncbi:MAG TPA: hypothetical protein VFA34_04415, partial [Actinomycetota bacterium]|nr:hypothetical protein [Actinomycetota bacterium]